MEGEWPNYCPLAVRVPEDLGREVQGKKSPYFPVGIGPIKPTFLTASPKGLQGSQGVRKRINIYGLPACQGNYLDYLTYRHHLTFLRKELRLREVKSLAQCQTSIIVSSDAQMWT